MSSVWLRVNGLAAIRPEVIIESLQDLVTTLITIVHLNLLILVTDQLLDVNSTLTSHSKHDSALSCKLSVRDLRLLNREVRVEFRLLGAHVILSSNGSSKLL